LDEQLQYVVVSNLYFKRLCFYSYYFKENKMCRVHAHIGERTNTTGVWWGNLTNRDYLEDPGVGRGTILECTLNRQDDRVWTGLFWLRIGTSSRLL
jgi:hypothetical protein